MPTSSVSGRQIAAARALLGLSRTDVATKAGLTEDVVAHVEDGITAEDTAADALRTTLESTGIEFIDGGAPGVRLRPTAQGLRADQLNASNDD